MIFATSSGVPSRCSGICCSTILSVPGDRIEVSISPGAIELTRTPMRPKSDAISRVNEASAAFEVAYAAPANGCTRDPAIEVTFTTEPFAAFNSSISPRAIMIGAKKLTRNTWLQVSTSVSMEPSRPPPAAFGEVDLDVILGARTPRAFLREGMPRTGEDAPAGAGKADHGRVPDAAAGSGKKQRAPRRVGGIRHGGPS